MRVVTAGIESWRLPDLQIAEPPDVLIGTWETAPMLRLEWPDTPLLVVGGPALPWTRALPPQIAAACEALQKPQSLPSESDLQRIAASEAPVLITGESGTGKEVMARRLHSASMRSERPFVAVNCGAIPETLIEAELFGHEKGAFTGAYRTKKGYFERANSGTIFLDEIGELPAAMQVRLLRVLQDGTICRLGAESTQTVSVRVLAATNRNLADEMTKGQFREDLYYRLAVFSLALPPLRERVNEILALAQTFLGPDYTLSKGAQRLLTAYRWPGNIRELENAITRAKILATREVEPEHLGLQLPTS